MNRKRNWHTIYLTILACFHYSCSSLEEDISTINTCPTKGEHQCASNGNAVLECRTESDNLTWVTIENCEPGKCSEGKCEFGAKLVARANIGPAGGFVHSNVSNLSKPGEEELAPSQGLSILVPPGTFSDFSEVRVFETTYGQKLPPFRGIPSKSWILDLPRDVELENPVIIRMPISDIFYGVLCELVMPRLLIILEGDDSSITFLDSKDLTCQEGWVSVEVPHFSKITVSDISCVLKNSTWTYIEGACRDDVSIEFCNSWQTGSEASLPDYLESNMNCAVDFFLESELSSTLKAVKKASGSIYEHINVLLGLGPELDGENLELALSSLINDALPDTNSQAEVAAYAEWTLTVYLVWKIFHDPAFSNFDTFERYKLAQAALNASTSWAGGATKLIKLATSDVSNMLSLLTGGHLLAPILQMVKYYADVVGHVFEFVEDIGWASQFVTYTLCRDGDLSPGIAGPDIPECGEQNDFCCLSDAGFLGGSRPAVSMMAGSSFRDPGMQYLAEILYQINRMEEEEVMALLTSAKELVLIASSRTWMDSLVYDLYCDTLQTTSVLCTLPNGQPGRKRCIRDEYGNFVASPCDDFPTLNIFPRQEQLAVSAFVSLEVQAADYGSGLEIIGVDWGDGPIGSNYTDFLSLNGESEWSSDDWFKHLYREPGEYSIVVTAGDGRDNEISRTRRLAVTEVARSSCVSDDDCPGITKCECLTNRCWVVPPELESTWNGSCQPDGGCTISSDCGAIGWSCNDGECKRKIARNPGCSAGVYAKEICDNHIDDDCDGVSDEYDCEGQCESDTDCDSTKVCHRSSGLCLNSEVITILDREWNSCFDRQCGLSEQGGNCGRCSGDAICTSRGRCNHAPVAKLRFDRTTASLLANQTAVFNYNIRDSFDLDGDPIRIMEFTSNGVGIGPQTYGYLELGLGRHEITVEITDGHRSTVSEPVLLTVTERDCTPQCEGRECGYNQCGGSCGNCSDDAYCNQDEGKCVNRTCGATSRAGCCNGPVRNWCHINRYILSANCSDPHFGGTTCGWIDEKQRYGCGGSGEDPSGENPIECQTGCVQECLFRECGPDPLCRESCGSCGDGEVCNNGYCVPNSNCVENCGGGVFVPAGSFGMGCGDEHCLSDNVPHHEVHVSEFEIDLTEVTVADYRRCVDVSQCDLPEEDDRCNCYIEGRDDHPMSCVSWYQAKAYCQWTGRRLCTEAEWEKAARGTDGRAYPWGNEQATCEYAVICEWNQTPGCGYDSSWSVGSKPAGISPYGVLDMTGNIKEWVEDDWHESYNNAPNDGGMWIDNPRSEWRVLRGGSWCLNGGMPGRTFHRLHDNPNLEWQDTGIRCCRTQ